MRIRRTLLFVNGYERDKLLQAIDSNTDCIVMELEDLCPPHMKEAARAGTVDALMNLDFKGKERIVRINDPRTELGKADLEAILPAHPDALRLPKCDTVEYVLEADKKIAEAEEKYGFEPGSIELIIVIETPLGVKNAYELASCCPRVTGITLGAGDLTSAMGINRDLTPGSIQLLYAKQKLVMASKVANIQVHDTTVHVPDGVVMDDFIREDTERDKMMGFTGRSVSVFSHIDIINAVYAPTMEEYELSKSLIVGYQDALTRGEKEDIWVNGKFVDNPVVTRAQKVIDYYEQLRECK